MQSNTIKYIKDFFMLGDSPKHADAAKKLEARMIRREFANDEIICHIGEEADAMYFIESGKVEVLGSDNTVVNEMEPDQYFGEYSIMTGDKRLSTIRSKGRTVVYRLDKKAVLAGLKYQPAVYGSLIKHLYAQISQKHTRITSLISERRGIIRDKNNQKKMSIKHMIIHYSIVLLVFLFAMFFPANEKTAPVMILMPIVFLIMSITITRRTLESIVQACLLSMVILYKFNFIFGFFNKLLLTVTSRSTMEIIIIIFLLGSITRLLSCSGGINALKRIAMERLKTKRSSLCMSLLCIIVIFIDDYLSLLINGVCLVPVNDKKRVPREMSSFVMGMSAASVCSLVPLSIWGIFISGIIVITMGENGMAVFYRSIPFNFVSIFILVMSFLAAMGILPLIGNLKAAQKRVESGGPLWPPKSEQYFRQDDDIMRGNIINLFFPIFFLIAASITCGTLVTGSFSINIGYGLIITLVIMFIFYCFQRLMTPEEFFDNIITGAESMLVPVLLIVLTLCFSKSVTELGLIDWLSGILSSLGSSNRWILPPVLFLFFTVISMLMGSSWAMYAFGLPIAIQLAQSTDGNLALCIGSVCAAGIAGISMSFYQSDNLIIAAAVGCEPTVLVKARLPYMIFLTILASALYLAAGIILS